ncbi:FkbM family methyltransferase [Bacillus sp. 1P06AnD]|uniref:FkbM family methyltransferase n=1 Tax=Bacillus sp. 1P06AnD TaxID=3132208 RepID=UPI0039A31C2C
MHGTYIGEGKILVSPTWGGHLIIPAADLSITPHLIISGQFEPPLTHYVLQNIKPGQTVLDVGANFGYYTTLFGLMVGAQGKVIAYEPDPHMFSFLSDNIGTNYLHQQIELRNRAVYSESKKLTLHVSSKFSGHSSIYKRDSEELRKFDMAYDPFVEEVTVKAETLDEAFSDEVNFDFLKMDIEGGEYHAFLGMKNLILQKRVKTMVFEWSRQALGENVSPFIALLDEYSRKTGKQFYVLNHNGLPIATSLAVFSAQEFIHSVLFADPL